MPIISAIANENNRWKRNAKKKKKKKTKGDGSYRERVRAKSCYPFDMFLNPSFKIMISFVNIARTTSNTSKFIY